MKKSNLSINNVGSRHEIKERFKQNIDAGLIKEIINCTFEWSKVRKSKKDEVVTFPISEQVDKIPDGGCGLIWYIENGQVQNMPVQIVGKRPTIYMRSQIKNIQLRLQRRK